MTRYLPIVTFFLLILPLQSSGGERLREANFPVRYQLDQVDLELKNQTVLNYLWLDVYAAAFYAEPRLPPSLAAVSKSSQRLALYYFRDIDRDDLIKAAWVALQRQHDAATLGRLRPAVEALHSHFRDIRRGDRYALNYSPQTGLSLEHNGVTVFTSADGQLARAYLGIWLAPEGLSEELRESLLANSRQ